MTDLEPGRKTQDDTGAEKSQEINLEEDESFHSAEQIPPPIPSRLSLTPLTILQLTGIPPAVPRKVWDSTEHLVEEVVEGSDPRNWRCVSVSIFLTIVVYVTLLAFLAGVTWVLMFCLDSFAKR